MPKAAIKSARKTIVRKGRKPRTSQPYSGAQIAKALRMLERHNSGAGNVDPELKAALKFYRMAKKFFANGGRFRRPYTRKKKTAA